MSKRGSISSKQLNEIKQLNKRISKKKSNLKHRHGLIADVERIDINASAEQRRKQIQVAKAFLNPNANAYTVRNEHGVATTKRKWNEMERITKSSNRQLEKAKTELLNMPYKVDGQVVGKVKTAVADSNEFKPIENPFKYITSDTAFDKALEKRRLLFGKNFIQNRQELYKENYIKGLKEHYGDTTDVRPLIQFIRNMDSREFYLHTKTNAGLEIKDIYDPRMKDEALEALYTDWGLDEESRTYDPNVIDPTDDYKRDPRTGAHLESYFSRRQGLDIMESARRRMKVNNKRRK